MLLNGFAISASWLVLQVIFSIIQLIPTTFHFFKKRKKNVRFSFGEQLRLQSLRFEYRDSLIRTKKQYLRIV